MQRRILVVEDEQPIREMLAFILSQQGYQAVEAADLAAAQQQLREPYPELILLDWMLPGGSGVNWCK